MKVLILLVAVCAALGARIDDSTPSLEGAKVYSVKVETEDHVTLVFKYDGVLGYDILSRRQKLGDVIDILVIANFADSFEATLIENEISYTIRSQNVQAAVEEEASRQRIALARRTTERITFDAYHRYDTIVSYMRQLAAEFSDIATLFQVGTSYEGRVIYGLKVSSGGSGKPAILIDATIHAREWIAPAVATYFINQLVEVSSNADLYASVDWYFIPVVNPDGYEYSHTNYRLWRKTRAVNINNWVCRGVDGNRNFGYHWMENGASNNPCSDIYAGRTAFSEPETQALRDFVLAHADTIKMYLTFHSYGNYLIYPWGYTSALPDNADQLYNLGIAAAAALASYNGTQYSVGSSTNVLYAAAGGGDDWVKGVGGVELAYTLEFPGGGSYGFDLPASRILDVSKESWLAMRVLAQYVIDNY